MAKTIKLKARLKPTRFLEEIGNRQGHGNGASKLNREDGGNSEPNLVDGTNSLVHLFWIHFSKDKLQTALSLEIIIWKGKKVHNRTLVLRAMYSLLES